MSNPTATRSTTVSRPPLAPGLPVIGNAHQMLEDVQPYFVRLYQQLGPIFRVRILRREVTVMAGLEANRFLAKQGDDHFGSQELFGGFAEEMETEEFLTALDGERHRYLRRILRPGYARSAAVPHLPRLIDLVSRTASAWQPGQRVPVLATMQRLIIEQLGVALVNHAPGEYYDAIWTFLRILMNVEVMKVWPSFMLRLNPSYAKAKARVLELGRLVLEEHRQTPADGRQRDLIDDLLEARKLDGAPFSENDLINAAIGPYFAGMDTVASTVSFMLYAILKHPDVYKRVLAEVDAVFARGTPALNDIRNMKALHGTALETLRMYTATPFTPRTAVRSFEFAGYGVEEGAEVWVAQSVTHYLPEYYPAPFTFDIDRHDGPQAEGRPPNTFAPYTLGAHTCLGAGLAEVQIMLTIATLLRTVSLELDPPDYQLRVKSFPIPNPGQKLAVRVLAHREG